MLREAELDLLACACAGDLGVVSALQLLSGDATEAVRQLVERRGDVGAAVAALQARNLHGAAQLLREASTRVPPAHTDEAVATLQAARAVERWRRTAQTVLRLCSANHGDPETLLAQIEAAVVPALYAQAATGPVQTADRLVERFIERYTIAEREQAIPSGLEAIDSRMGGWRRGHLHLVCGLTGIGKTSLLVQAAMRAVKAGFRAYIVSGELPANDLIPRLLGEELGQYVAPDGSEVSVLRVLRRDPDLLDVLQAVHARSREALARLVIDARGWVSLQEAVSAFAACHALAGVDLLLVDYLQLLHGNSSRNYNREREVAEAAEVLKRLAMRHDVAVVAAAQLVDPPAWGPEQQRSAAPAVRESRAAAHAADLVVELHRHQSGAAGSNGEQYLLRITKSRHFAPPGDVVLTFDRRLCRFRELGPASDHGAAL